MESQLILIFGFILFTISIITIKIITFEKRRIKRRDYYREYLKTDAWKRKRYVVLKRDNWTCQRCGAKAEQVHHKKYARNIGREPIKWLESICKDCHHKIHSKSSKPYFKTVKREINIKKNKTEDFNKAENHISAIESKHPKNSLQTNWSWSVEMNLCPKLYSKKPLINYYNNIKVDKIFCEDKNKGIHPKGLDAYHKKWKVIEHSLSDDKDKLWVIIRCENPPNSIKFFVLEITFHKKLKIRIYKNNQWIIETKSNVFLHNRFSRTLITYEGAKKMLFEKQGKKWVGKEPIDDWIL